VQNFSYYVYFISLHVSADYVPIIRRNNCIYATLGTCYSLWMTIWYAYQTVILMMMGTQSAETCREKIYILRKIVQQVGFIYRMSDVCRILRSGV
jgi:hypothetical protein